MSAPGRHAPALAAAAAGARPSDLVRIVQGLILHDWAAPRLYGAPPPGFSTPDRTTLPVADRLALILQADPRPLDQARPVFERSLGTCRDMALMLAALFREGGRAARVRCGFADYLRPGRWEDHWVCDYEDAGSPARWRRADAQLDAAHRAALSVSFDPADLPDGRFIDAAEAWRRVRSGATAAEAFGHGEEGRGLWFLRVNLARDRAALADDIVTDWDRWREDPALRRADAAALAEADGWAAAIDGR